MAEKRPFTIWEILAILAAMAGAAFLLLVGFVFLTCGGVCK